MTKSVLLSLATVLLGGTALAAPAAQRHAQIFVTGTPPGSQTLYDQNRDDAENAIFSQNLDDTQAADDFVVPTGHSWQITEVDVTGVYYDGSSAATSENVFFYSDNNGLPGDLIVSCPNENGVDNGLGSFAITLSKTCKVKLDGSVAAQTGKASRGTTYWLSVQTNVNPAFANAWGWELSSDTKGNQGAWQNPQGSVCQTWTPIKKCTGTAYGLMFALKGKDKG